MVLGARLGLCLPIVVRCLCRCFQTENRQNEQGTISTGTTVASSRELRLNVFYICKHIYACTFTAVNNCGFCAETHRARCTAGVVFDWLRLVITDALINVALLTGVPRPCASL